MGWLSKVGSFIKDNAHTILDVAGIIPGVGASLLKKLNPKNLYKSFKDKMKDVCLFGKCFTGDTLVCTEKGYVPICEIKVGDLVLSREETTGETGYKKVEQISITETHTIHLIEVDGSTVIKTTAYHPFYVEGHGWVSAINLKEGDCLITPNGVLCITKVEKERYEEPVSMYNFHVEDWVSYFVTELNIYVHNSFGEHKVDGKPGTFADMMDADEAARYQEHWGRMNAETAPIQIPPDATMKIQSKTGYNQIQYKWSDDTYKYDARWHTKTPGAPEGQGNTWVVERITPGNANGQRSTSNILTGENTWTPRSEWQDAITARKIGTATELQNKMLEDGHWPAP